MLSVDLTGKVVLVTGGARGMGASHARSVVEHGGQVLIADLLDAEGEALANALGDAAVFTSLDVTSTAGWTGAVERAMSEFGGLHVLVNNAGVLIPSSIIDQTDENWNKVLDINLTGQFKGIRASAPAIASSGGGSIINISSTAGIRGFEGAVAYTTSKFGVRGLTKASAIELARQGIRVNSVHPGNVDTAMIAGAYADYSHVPQQRAANVEEITSIVIYLASDASSFATGAEFIVDGGETAGSPWK